MAQVLQIVKHPHVKLKERSRVLTLDEISSQKIQNLIDDMIATMWAADGIGIAGTQVGQNLRLVIVTKDSHAYALINPTITRRSFRQDTMEEGCLSVPGFHGPVKRPKTVRVKAWDRNGKIIKFKAEGLLAKIVQHEIDHINGMLFIDRAKKVFPLEHTPQL